MASSQKRKISAREIVADIRAGMTASQLETKYGLSPGSLESVCKKLVSAGAITERELPKTHAADEKTSEKTSRVASVNCPACNASLPAGATECAICGVVPAKFAARSGSDSPRSTMLSGHASSPGKRWIYVAVLFFGCILVGTALMFWPGERKPEDSAPARKADTTQKRTAKKKGKDPAARKQETQGLYMSKAEDKPTDRDDRVTDFQFSAEGFPFGLSVSQGFAVHLFETPSENQGFKKLPPESGVKRYYDEFSIAGTTYLVISEESNPPTLYWDANQNGDLTDDPGPFPGEQPGLVPNHFTVMLPAKNSESGVPYRMWLFPSRMGGVRFYPQCHWHAELKLSGNNYKMVLFDANADGDYSNDSLAIDLDNDGNASSSELVKPGETINIDGIPVKLLSIAPSGRWAEFEF